MTDETDSFEMKMMNIAWTDSSGKKWSGACLTNDGTVERILVSGGTVNKVVVIG